MDLIRSMILVGTVISSAGSVMVSWTGLGIPYIIYRSGWHQPSRPETRVWRFYHPFFERLCDVLLFEEKYGKNLWEEPFQPQMPPYQEVEGLLMLPFELSLNEVYAKDDDPRLLRTRLRNTFGDAIGFFDHFNPYQWEPHGWQKFTEKGLRLIHPRILPEVDFLNTQGGPWIHPGTLVEEDSGLLELYEQALLEARSIVAAGGIAKDWKDPEGYLLDTSLNLTDDQGRRVGPELADPFDLHKVMLDQLEWLRGSLIH
jgi:hypothetical protein